MNLIPERFEDYSGNINSSLSALSTVIDNVLINCDVIKTNNDWANKFSGGIKSQILNLEENLKKIKIYCNYYINGTLAGKISSYKIIYLNYKKSVELFNNTEPKIEDGRDEDGSIDWKTNPVYAPRREAAQKLESEVLNKHTEFDNITNNRLDCVYIPVQVTASNLSILKVPNLESVNGALNSINTELNGFKISIFNEHGHDVVINNIMVDISVNIEKCKTKIKGIIPIFESYFNDTLALEAIFSGEKASLSSTGNISVNHELFSHGTTVVATGSSNGSGGSSGSGSATPATSTTITANTETATATTTSNPYENMGGDPNEIIELEDPSGNIIYQTRAEIYSGPGAGGVSTEEATANYNNFLNEQNSEVTTNEVPITESNVANSSDIHGESVKTGEDPFGNEYVENPEDRYTGPGALPRETTEAVATQGGQEDVTQVSSVNGDTTNNFDFSSSAPTGSDSNVVTGDAAVPGANASNQTILTQEQIDEGYVVSDNGDVVSSDASFEETLINDLPADQTAESIVTDNTSSTFVQTATSNSDPTVNYGPAFGTSDPSFAGESGGPGVAQSSTDTGGGIPSYGPGMTETPVASASETIEVPPVSDGVAGNPGVPGDGGATTVGQNPQPSGPGSSTEQSNLGFLNIELGV